MTHPEPPSGDRTRLDGDDLREMFSFSTRLFQGQVEAIDALNVFPVPDGDTGTNMFLTLGEVIKGAEAVEGASAGEVAAAMARGALMGARGNSGVILSQFFKGLSGAMGDGPDIGAAELAEGLELARKHAYTSVGQPVEGTMLTVMTSAARIAREAAETGAGPLDLCDAVCRAARETVALTPTMLPVLREAGVVDAGGQGLSVILEGMRSYLRGDDVDELQVSTPAPIGVTEGTGTASDSFLDAAELEEYGYCTQFLITGNGFDPEAVREQMASEAKSAVVVGDESMMKVHVHALDPGPVISLASSLGTLSQVKIESMDEQHRGYAATRRAGGSSDPVRESLPMAVVTVAWGGGLEDVFTGLGAAGVLRGGDTMNPSIQEVVDAVEAAPSESVIFLPNNRNIIPAARQAAELSAKDVRVVPSATIPQGIAALLAFNGEGELAANVAEMERMASSVRTGEVCHAVRPVTLNGVTVRQGQVIGLLERQLVAAGDDPNQVLLSLLQAADVSEEDLVTLYWGGSMASAHAEEARGRLEATLPGVEIEVVPGGQPHYHYIVSIE